MTFIEDMVLQQDYTTITIKCTIQNDHFICKVIILDGKELWKVKSISIVGVLALIRVC